MVTPSIPQRFSCDPFALNPTDDDAAKALAPAMTQRQVAWQPRPFNQGDEEQFIERWLSWFADAASGNLTHPSKMPDDPGGGGYRFDQSKRRPRQ